MSGRGKSRGQHRQNPQEGLSGTSPKVMGGGEPGVDGDEVGEAVDPSPSADRGALPGCDASGGPLDGVACDGRWPSPW